MIKKEKEKSKEVVKVVKTKIGKIRNAIRRGGSVEDNKKVKKKIHDKKEKRTSAMKIFANVAPRRTN